MMTSQSAITPGIYSTDKELNTYTISIYWNNIVGAFAWLAIVTKLSISPNIVFTGSCGGNASASTLVISSCKFCGVTSPYVENRWSNIFGIVCVNIFVARVLNAGIYLGFLAVTSCYQITCSTPITSWNTRVSSTCLSWAWAILYWVIPSSSCNLLGLSGE